ncbi:hypothetical protein TEA_008060 [Camellia sinensis var. sinensis]|uniref:Uncharacterized protein n=1 Tax=Camellia sinensis var. sinensis TaxID=542762 RepID=A0A4S4DAU0_CAMSN|nr:hypothetical protein TEA_008060 [Camellia sinensis var. sinensis]
MNISQWNNNFKKIGLHSLSSLKTLWIEGKEEEHPMGSSFPIDGMLLPTSLIVLWIRNFRNLEKLSSKLFQNLASLECLYIGDCPRLTFLTSTSVSDQLCGDSTAIQAVKLPGLGELINSRMAVIYRCFEKVLSATDITYTLEIPRTAAYLPENNDASMHVWDQRDKAWELRMTIREDQRKALKRKEWLRLATENDAETFDLSSSEAVDFLDTFLSMNPDSRVLRWKACDLSEKEFLVNISEKQVLNDVLQKLHTSDCKATTIISP